MYTRYNSPLGIRYKPLISYIWSKDRTISLMVDVWVYGHNQLMKRMFPDLLSKDSMLFNDFESSPDETRSELFELIDSYEESLQHETVAILSAVKEVLYKGVPTLFHVGLTSSDVQDQVTLAQQIESLIHLGALVEDLLSMMSSSARKGLYDKELVGRTHLQPAEPTTLLHRMSLFAHDLMNWHSLAAFVIKDLLSPYLGVMAGSVGTHTNLIAMLDSASFEKFQMPFNTTRPKSQTLPRMLDVHYAQVIDSLAAILHKFALDFRLESGFGSIVETKSHTRVGSSAMPYKKNPIVAENICSLSRHIHHLLGNAWNNASEQMLERSLDDSANRRFWIPESTLLADHILQKTEILVADLQNIKETPAESWSKTWLISRQQAMNQLTTYLSDSIHLNFKVPIVKTDTYLEFSKMIDKTQLGNLSKKYQMYFHNIDFKWPKSPVGFWYELTTGDDDD